MMYIVITSVVLIFLNIYTAATTRNLVFQTNSTSLQNRAQLIATSLSGLEELSEENARQVVNLMGGAGTTRLVVTDPSGCAVYDSLQQANQIGDYLLLPELVQALDGNDVFYCRYGSGAVESHVAVPIMSYDKLIGAVYLMEYDTNQGQLIAGLGQNILSVTAILAVGVCIFSLFFSNAFSGRTRQLLESFSIVRDGDYTHRIQMRGRKDELGQLADAFNDLTARLEESEQMRRRFVSDASHELKTPLASIKLLSDSILQNTMDIDMIREFVGDIGHEADRLNRMSQKLMELSKADDGIREQLEAVSVEKTVHRVLRMLTPQMEARHLRLETQVDPACSILTAEDDLYQILFNLVENAIKYNVDGGLLRLQAEQAEGETIIRVIDSGIGIPEEALEHLFDRFFRVDKARSRADGGSGLGLSIVKDMTQRSGGTVSVSNRPSGGACFTLRFPLEKEDLSCGE